MTYKIWRAYVKRILAHKWYVYQECRKLGIPWRGVVHDISKLSRAEWRGYAMMYTAPKLTGESPSDEDVAVYERAWHHHAHNNLHHWNYWITPGGTELRGSIIDMPMVYRLEMVADWRAMAKEKGGSAHAWYNASKHVLMLHPNVARWFETEIWPSS